VQTRLRTPASPLPVLAPGRYHAPMPLLPRERAGRRLSLGSVRRGLAHAAAVSLLVVGLAAAAPAQEGPAPPNAASAAAPARAPGLDTARLSRAIVETSLATVFAAIGILAVAAGLRWRTGRASALLLGAAMLLHAVNRLAGERLIGLAIGGPPEAWIWIRTITNYLILLPWGLLFEQVVGPGWKSSVRRTGQLWVAYAVTASLVDLALGRPGAAAIAYQPVVLPGALVFLANLSFGPVRLVPELRALRAGSLVFMALVILDSLRELGILPWWRPVSQFGLAVLAGCLVYTVVSRAWRDQGRLRAIEQELATARRIQTALLPRGAPEIRGAVLAFRHVPAAAVAGDLYQFLEVGPRGVGILVADVSGHGVAAALIASMVKVAAAAQQPRADDPARVLAGIHFALARELPCGQFVTAVYVYVDLERGLVRHASAGHPPALIQRAADRTIVPAGATGPLLISLAPAEYPVSEWALDPGDRLLLYTDGVTEAMGAGGKMFGLERLTAVMANGAAGPEALLGSVIGSVRNFAGRPESTFEDDLTLVALEVLTTAD
jgi:phosphoserine phosphatase RsbU/P